MKRTFILAALAAAASLTGLAMPASVQASERANWTATVAVLPDGTHVLGNPDADIKLTEFVSYTCSHCATFQNDSDAPLRLAYVMPGKVSMRVVHLVRDPADLTAAMLTNCGKPEGFFARHHIFLNAQEKWLAKARTLNDAQRARWNSGPMATRMRAVASDLGFYDIMAHRGFGRAAVDRCLADTETAKRIAGQMAEVEELGVPGTPSFAINGELIEAVHDWTSLNEQIKSRL